MKLSIITVTYNSEKTVEETIKSVKKQTYNNIEYIVVDGGSTDNTLKVINENRNFITKIISEPDNGIYDAMNKGIDYSTGEVIAILNSDDYYYNNYVIEDVVSAFTKNDVDSIYSDLLFVDRFDNSKIIRFWKSRNFKLNDFLYGWMPPHPTFFVKKSVYDKFGKFNLSLNTSADYEFIIRVLYKFQISSKYIDKTFVIMRTGGASDSSIISRIMANNNDKLAWEINDIKPYFFTTWFKPLRKIFQFFL